eukprot:Colp12_sorted_trinity150504_noHs@11994
MDYSNLGSDDERSVDGEAIDDGLLVDHLSEPAAVPKEKVKRSLTFKGFSSGGDTVKLKDQEKQDKKKEKVKKEEEKEKEKAREKEEKQKAKERKKEQEKELKELKEATKHRPHEEHLLDMPVRHSLDEQRLRELHNTEPTMPVNVESVDEAFMGDREEIKRSSSKWKNFQLFGSKRGSSILDDKEKPEKSDKTEKSDKHEKSEKHDKPDKSDKGEKSEKGEKAEKEKDKSSPAPSLSQKVGVAMATAKAASAFSRLRATNKKTKLKDAPKGETRVFEVPLEEAVERSSVMHLPTVVHKCISYLDEKALEQEGL